MIHEMKLASQPFTMIASGLKTIELRLYDEKRQKIKIHDIIRFKNISDGSVVTAKVIKINVFENFTELYKKLDLLKCGYTKQNIHSAKPQDMFEYYSEDKQRLYGVVGIEIQLIS